MELDGFLGALSFFRYLTGVGSLRQPPEDVKLMLCQFDHIW
jgi:hypothetical protein